MTVLDRAHFEHMTGGDRALQAEVIGLFRAQADGWRTRLNETADWRGAAHTLKGSARGIGLAPLAAACEAAEGASDVDAPATLERVRAELERALSALDQFVADAR
jgi:HPt (histidine-containing phosphotransfer) domain-containing protein